VPAAAEATAAAATVVAATAALAGATAPTGGGRSGGADAQSTLRFVSAVAQSSLLLSFERAPAK